MKISNLSIDTDYGRDIYEMSNIYLGKTVWLGPRLSPGLSASPAYYYLYYPSTLMTTNHLRGPIYLNLGVTILVIAILLYTLMRKHVSYLRLAVSTALILSIPLIHQLAPHPGNGYSYALFLLASLCATHYTKHLFISALLFGLSVSMHPASILATPILIGAYLQLRPNWKQMLSGIIAFTLPFSPIILFEIITRGFLIRQWQASPSVGLNISTLGWDNLAIIANQLGLGQSWILLALTTLILLSRKTKIWHKLTLGLGILFFANLTPVPVHYLFGTSITVIYIALNTLWQKGKLGVLLILSWAILAMSSPPAIPPQYSRPLQSIESNVSTIVEIDELKDKRIAVVAVLPGGTSVPQADDYRGLLRMAGMEVLELSQHSEADYLLYIVEQDGFEWESWSSWESESFGDKQLVRVVESEHAKLVLWGR